jgi:hypothetical protein
MSYSTVRDHLNDEQDLCGSLLKMLRVLCVSVAICFQDYSAGLA